MAITMIVSFMALAMSIFLMSEDEAVLSIELIASVLFVAVLFVLVLWFVQKLAKQRLGIDGNAIVMETHKGRYTAKGSDLHYGSRHIGTNEVILNIGDKRQAIFDRGQVEKWVFPRLKGARRIGHLERLKIQWRSKDPVLRLNIVALLGFVLIVVCLSMPYGL